MHQFSQRIINLSLHWFLEKQKDKKPTLLSNLHNSHCIFKQYQQGKMVFKVHQWFYNCTFWNLWSYIRSYPELWQSGICQEIHKKNQKVHSAHAMQNLFLVGKIKDSSFRLFSLWQYASHHSTASLSISVQDFWSPISPVLRLSYLFLCSISYNL